MREHRPLTRSLTDRVLAGVCGGIAAYTGINALWLRLIWLVLAPTTQGYGVVLYLVLWLAMRIETMDDLPPLSPVAPGSRATPGPDAGKGRLAVGLAAILAGVVLFVLGADWLPVPAGALFGPVAALAAGAALLWRQHRGV
ncbi:MAG: PspC domain-containing protein [Anaerolineae bacterium]|nr:PspC domain-containing protein [Anaerolineae bacterium]